MVKRVLWVVGMVGLLGFAGIVGGAAPATGRERKPVVYLIGDSTVRNGTLDNGATNGQWGWGHVLHYYFDEGRIRVENDAMGGTSSRSYWESPALWKLVLPKIQAGDYVIMQFGHNDSRGSLKGNGEETEERAGPNGGAKQTVHTYGWYIRQYIREVKAKGATPIVCSLIPRNRWTEGKVGRNDKDYALWAKEAAAQEGAAFIPLNTLVAEAYDTLGQEKVAGELFPPKEAVHPNWAGSALNAAKVVEGIRGLELPLKGYLKAKAKVPAEPDVKAGGHGELGPEGEKVLERRRGGRPATGPAAPVEP